MPNGTVTVPFDLCDNRELEEEEADFGTELPGAGFEARIAESPVALSYRKLFADHGLEAPPVYGGQFELWLVPHRVSVVRRSGLSEIVSLGLRAAYKHGRKTCSVVALVPEFQFVDVGGLKFSAIADSTGTLRPATGLAASTPVVGTKLSIGVSANASASIALELTVSTPVIQAMGKGATYSEWIFEKTREPLFGRDVETWALILLPRSQRTLEYDLTMSLTRRLAFVPTRWESRAVTVRCTLLEPPA